ncbi:hypothetical protein AAKU67_003732 [Oxalobacteraceae bacterium GrIS 2.11]
MNQSRLRLSLLAIRTVVTAAAAGEVVPFKFPASFPLNQPGNDREK